MDRPPLKILLVEDNPGDARLVGELLAEAASHAVELEWVDRLSRGLDRLTAGNLDLVLLDLGLPDSQGLETLDRVKAQAPRVPIVLLTGLDDETTAVEALRRAAEDYVVKGAVNGPALVRILRYAVERKQATNQLLEVEARYRTLFAQSPDGVLVLDPETMRPIEFNDQAHRQLGYSREEFEKLSVADYETSETLEETRAHVTNILRQGKDQFETKHRTKEGEIRDVLVNVQRINLSGRDMVFAVLRDITERKRTEEALRQSEKLATMGELLAGVAHELNNPLSVVLGRAAILSQMAKGGPFAAQAEKIAAAGTRCARIVRNFLALARNYPPERQGVTLNKVVSEAVELLAYPLRVDNVEAIFDLADDLPSLWADSHQLQQVVVNLISNAHHAMRETPEPRRLTFTTRHDGARARVLLQVADTGPGIPPEVQAKIFDPFFTTKPPGQGTGLGLYLCHGIVEAHGGAIRVESEPGHGAVFEVDLPVGPLPPAQGEVPTADVAEPTTGKTILLVDDEPEVAALLAEILSADGHRVDTAANGAVALDKLRERAYDLILSDLRMPEVDGPGLYREVQRRHPQLLPRMIFFTGDTLSQEMRAFLEETGVPQLNKPFDFGELQRMVTKFKY